MCIQRKQLDDIVLRRTTAKLQLRQNKGMTVRLTQRRVTGFKDMNKQTAQCPSCIRSDRGENCILCHWSVRLEWREGKTNRGEQSWQQLLSAGVDVPKRGDVEVGLHSSRVWTKRRAGVQRSCTRKHQTLQACHDYRRTLRPNQTPIGLAL